MFTQNQKLELDPISYENDTMVMYVASSLPRDYAGATFFRVATKVKIDQKTNEPLQKKYNGWHIQNGSGLIDGKRKNTKTLVEGEYTDLSPCYIPKSQKVGGKYIDILPENADYKASEKTFELLGATTVIGGVLRSIRYIGSPEGSQNSAKLQFTFTNYTLPSIDGEKGITYILSVNIHTWHKEPIYMGKNLLMLVDALTTEMLSKPLWVDFNIEPPKETKDPAKITAKISFTANGQALKWVWGKDKRRDNFYRQLDKDVFTNELFLKDNSFATYLERVTGVVSRVATALASQPKEWATFTKEQCINYVTPVTINDEEQHAPVQQQAPKTTEAEAVEDDGNLPF